MSFTDAPVIRITNIQEYLGQQVINVYHYTDFIETPNPDLNLVLDDFETKVMDVVRDFQNTLVEHNFVRLERLNNGTRVIERAISLLGQRSVAQDVLNSSLSLSFKLVRNSGDTRSGRKSITGMYVGDILGNRITAATKTLAGPLEAAFLSTLTDGIATFTPVILGIQNPQNAEEWNVNTFSTVLTRDIVGTQVSRKEGVGA